MTTDSRSHADRHIDIVALCGSLRAQSYNAALLDAAARVAPHGMRIVRFDRLGEFRCSIPIPNIRHPPRCAT